MIDYALVSVLGDGTTPTWLPTATDFAGVTDTATALAGVVAPVIVSVMAIVIGIKLMKKFVNKIG